MEGLRPIVRLIPLVNRIDFCNDDGTNDIEEFPVDEDEDDSDNEFQVKR